MIEVGEVLGNRYRVSRVPEDLRPGAVVELTDRGVTAMLGQVLADGSVPPAMLQEVRAELTVVPAMPTIVKPRDLALSARGVPLGVIERPGLARLRDRVAAVDPEQKKGLATSLLRAIATLASDLAMLHQSGHVHGAITSAVLLTGAAGEVSGALLSGFGLTAFARRLDKLAKEPTARGDLVDLLGALHDLFVAAGVQPDGSAAAKWTLLRHAAMHGEHPALASGNALATQLNEIASLPAADERPVRTSRTPTIAGPGRMRTSITPGAPSEFPSAERSAPASQVSRRTIPPGSRGAQAPAPQRPTRRWRFSAGILVGGLAGIVLLGAAAVYYAWDLRTPPATSSGRLVSVRRREAPPAACTGEPATPTAVPLAEPVREFDTVCAEGELFVATRAGSRVLAARRGAVRGRDFGEAQTVGEGVVEMGALLASESGTWVSWRHGIGDPFGVARLEAGGPTATRVVLPGWNDIAYHDATLVHADATRAWILTTVTAEAGAHAVLVEAPLAERGRVATWYLGAGEAVAYTTGPRATVLLDVRAPAQHALTAVGLDLAALAAAPAERPSVRGRDLPATAATRSSPVTLAGEALVAVRRGVVLPSGARAFLATLGDALAEDACPARGRCVQAGAVSLVVFPGTGEARTHVVSPRGWGEDLRGGEGESLEALVRPANMTGAPLDHHLVATVDAAGAVTPSRRLAASGPEARARLTHCGSEAWIVQPDAEPHRVKVSPAACAQHP